MPININKRSDVNSVNGKVGDVVLNASDIGALSKDTKIPTKTSELINDSNYISDNSYVHTDNNYTTSDKNSVATIGNKVDKVEGKGLSTNDLTDELKADYDDAMLQAHTHSNKTILDNTTASYTSEEKTKLSGIENNAQKNTVIGVKGEVETDYRIGNVNITKENIGLENVANERQWSETNHPTTMSGYGITDGASSTDYNTLKGRVDTNEDNIAMLDSDVEGLTTNVSTLKTDMTTVKSAVTTIQDDYVSKTRKVNGKALSADITLGASDVKAIPTSQKGTANGVAELDANGIIKTSQLPSSIDEIIEADSKSDFPTTGESSKIYIALDTNLTYRWAGTQYVEISPSLALGETISTAYRGDRGKIAYDHSQKTSGNPHNVTKKDVGLSNVPNVSTNDQTPTFTETTSLTKLTSGEKLSVAFGKISKAITDLINHIANKNNPHEVTKTQVGLSNVGNFKAVSTVASQGLTDTEKANARANIGAGTSSFSGSYNDLSNKPTIPSVGNGTVTIKQAGTSKGTFTMNQSGNTTIELTDNNTTYGVATSSALGLVKSGTDITVDSSGNVSVNDDSHNHIISNIDGLQSALDGKASSSHTHTKSEVGLGNVDNTADASKNVKSSKKLQTYKQGSTTETYGDNYPIYAQWRDSTHVKMKCDNYTVETDYATTAGSASSASKATQDESGNNIKSSYASSISISDHTITLKNKNGASLGTVTVPDNNTWRPLGTTADTACAGNDARLSNSRPASDVYDWAKASTKPSYTKSEIGLGNVDNTADANKSVKNADKLYNKSNDYYGVWLGGMTIPKGTEAGMSQSVAEDPLHRYIKPTSIIDIYYDDNSVQYASEIGMLYNIQESGGIYYLTIGVKKDVVKQDIVIQNILVRNP